ncbi:hypothetical protein LEP1GSC051_4281 [Leptospira sp. P2653]|uniref:Uncharacterized protein n=1 Tax=Leptospira weilii str. UI 13098 TaxID=1088542 RepID=M6Q571_9LEPT|nr:hypothetical protein LEP1GSC051_4281 [Leptospira sp. P2653]EMN44155.1 hypothetical protein LEP1GSC086_0797 [Leptospira weilii str. LNT 1234]EMN87858.1 hypothetical protein LEP1GSC108_0700 [Leptospira weilii str. UI 13098]
MLEAEADRLHVNAAIRFTLNFKVLIPLEIKEMTDFLFNSNIEFS